uniref:FHA domain-containing protein n=1 Tax=Trepomonas sp. PC1 TaxID=1076344 RepID=A0A146K964_9EUKA|eukprot:JAP92096.1 hypothetical protein TPC1_16071 [Trepomonas sp. PC1]
MLNCLCSLDCPSFSIDINFTPFSVGSSSESSITLDQLRPVHFTIVFNQSKYYIVPSGDVTVNGLYLNEFTPRMQLHDGSTVQFGKYNMSFVICQTAANAKEIMHLKHEMVQKLVQ